MKFIRKISWFEVVKPNYVRLKIIPDSSVRNYRSEDIIRTIADQFKLPIDRIIHEGIKLKGFKVQERASFEIDFSEGKVCFYLSVSEYLVSLISRRILSVWNKATIERVDNLHSFNFENTSVYELVYKKHDLYSLHTDSKDNLPLRSLIEAGRLLEDNDHARIFAYFEPIYQLSWQNELDIAWKKLIDGKAPRKWNTSARNIAMIIALGLTEILREFVETVSDILSTKGYNKKYIYNSTPNNIYNKNKYVNEIIDPEAMKYHTDKLLKSRQKKSKPGIKTYIWTIAESQDKIRSDIIAKTLASSFYDLSGDNELIPHKLNGKKKQEVLRVVETQNRPKININYNLMSTAEVSKIVQLPGKELQEEYDEIERIEQAEIEVNPILKQGGIPLGTAVYKGQEINVYQPIKNHEELCLPNISIAGMGQGKTKSQIPYLIINAVNKGFGALAIDPNKREIGDQLEHAIKAGIFKQEDFIRINLGKTTFSLDWCEALHDVRARARLAGTAIDFFGIAEETTGQTERFLRAAIMGMKTGRVSEVIRIFEDELYLKEIILGMPDGLNKTTLKQYLSYEKGMRGKILSPIYNRLNLILSDPHLAECVESENSLDMVELMSTKKAIVIDVPTDDLDKIAIDVIVNILSSKIDLAMRLREKVNGEKALFPFFVILDEPHQYLKSSRIWESAVVESRKWRVSYFWAFHYWEQIPQTLQKAIRSALCHYHIGPTSKFTWQSLKEEIYPLTVEEVQKLKSFHMVHLIRAGGEWCKPFISKSLLPPTLKYNV